MKRFFCLLTIVALLATSGSFGKSSIAQQKNDDEILAPGNPPLTSSLVDRMVEFFEYVFDTKFTKSQRTVFTSKVYNIWQSKDQKEIDEFVKASKAWDQITSMSETQRIEARPSVQSAVVKVLANEPPGSFEHYLLSIYTDSHPANAGQKPANPQPIDAGPRVSTRVPAELVGEWLARKGSGSSYVNPGTGSYSAPNATIDSYKFFSDGTYEHAMLMQSSLYNCTTTIVGREVGPVNVQGSELTITPRPGTLDYKSSCSPSLNSLKETKFDPSSFKWQLERDEYGLKLCLQRSDGVAGCYYKQ
ncbi:MAG: hypothetical protein M3R67_11510 [Acidobacteriota bacterium]|nr:hypothetical protein [Acidobacteriota bacterium]